MQELAAETGQRLLLLETAPLHVQDGDPCYTLAIFHDGEHKESNVDVEVQKSVKGSSVSFSQIYKKS